MRVTKHDAIWARIKAAVKESENANDGSNNGTSSTVRSVNVVGTNRNLRRVNNG